MSGPRSLVFAVVALLACGADETGSTTAEGGDTSGATTEGTTLGEDGCDASWIPDCQNGVITYCLDGTITTERCEDFCARKYDAFGVCHVVREQGCYCFDGLYPSDAEQASSS